MRCMWSEDMWGEYMWSEYMWSEDMWSEDICSNVGQPIPPQSSKNPCGISSWWRKSESSDEWCKMLYCYCSHFGVVSMLLLLSCCYCRHAATGVMLLLVSCCYCCYCRHAAIAVMLLLLSCCYCCHAMQTTPFRWTGEKKSEVTMRRHTHVKSVWRTYHLGVGVAGGRGRWAWPTWGRLQTASGWCYLPVCGIGARSTPPTLNGIHFTCLHRRAITYALHRASNWAKGGGAAGGRDSDRARGGVNRQR